MMVNLGFFLCCPRKRRKSGGSTCSGEDQFDENGAIVGDQAGYGTTEPQPVELYAVDEIDGISLSSDPSLRKVYIAIDSSVRYSQHGLPKIPLFLSPVPLDRMSVDSLASHEGFYENAYSTLPQEDITENTGDDKAEQSTLPDGSDPNITAEVSELDNILETEQPVITISEVSPQTRESVRSKKSDDSGVASLEGTGTLLRKKKKKKPKILRTFHMSFRKKKKDKPSTAPGKLEPKRRYSLFAMSTNSLARSRSNSIATSLSSNSQRKYSSALMLASLDDLSDDNICKD